MSTSIIAEHLSKEYSMASRGFQPGTLGGGIWGLLSGKMPAKARKFMALKDVSFEVGAGEILGVIGRNGAGKSTLLKILSRITPPTSGKAIMNGRVSSLLEVGTGFHPQLSGRENVFLNGTLLGMRKNEVQEKLEQIVDFAEIGDFLDMPIKQYSSGMKVRLAFSVAAHLQAEILIVDEVLAVGDAAFQQKCLGKMNEVARNSGKTILLVSHNMSAVKNLCSRAILLKGGEKVLEGSSDDVVKAYLNESLSEQPVMTRENIERVSEHVFTQASPTFSLNKISLNSIAGEARNEFLSDEEIEITTEIEVFREIRDMQFIISLVDDDNTSIISTELTSQNDNKITSPGIYEASCRIPANVLGQNKYFISAAMVNPSIEHLILTKGLSFNITFRKEDSIYIGKLAQAWLRPQLDWQFVQKKKTEESTGNASRFQKLA